MCFRLRDHALGLTAHFPAAYVLSTWLRGNAAAANGRLTLMGEDRRIGVVAKIVLVEHLNATVTVAACVLSLLSAHEWKSEAVWNHMAAHGT